MFPNDFENAYTQNEDYRNLLTDELFILHTNNVFSLKTEITNLHGTFPYPTLTIKIIALETV